MRKNPELDLLESNIKEKFQEFYENTINENLDLTLEEREWLIAKVIYSLIEEAIEKNFGSNEDISDKEKKECKLRLIKMWNSFRDGYEKKEK